MRVLLLVVSLGLVPLAAARAQAPADSTIRDKVEVREVPVLVDLPEGWRGEPVARLAQRVRALENGAERAVSALQPVAAPAGPGYARVEIAFDAGHCRTDLAHDAALALAGQAARLVGLGPVAVAAWSGSGLLLPTGPFTDATELAERLTERAAAPCMSLALDVPEHQLACPGTPCLLIWVAAGWGGGADAEAALAAAGESARDLAAGGWTVLGLAPVEAPAPEVHARAPETRPGDDRSSWTVNVLDPRGEREREREAAESARATELDLAPLRRIVAATAGELVSRADGLADALAALGGRSLLYYRTDRAPGGGPVPFELWAQGASGRRLRAFEWAPPLRP